MIRTTSPPLVWQHGNGVNFAVGSPRRISGEVKCVPVRQTSDFQRPTTASGPLGSPLASNEGFFSSEAPQGPPSPLTRSRSANLHLNVHRGPLSGVQADPTLLPMSPHVPHRDPSPSRSRSVVQGAGLAMTTPLPAHAGAAQRGAMPSYASGPPLPSSHLQTFPPPVQVPTCATPAAATAMPSATAMDTVLPSPRRDQRGVLDDGIRSPPPALAPPPQGHTYPHLKQQLDCTPHSARNGLVVGSLAWPAQQQPLVPPQDSRQPADTRSITMKQRWDQASPCRMRFVGANAAAAAASGGTPYLPAHNMAPVPRQKMRVASGAS